MGVLECGSEETYRSNILVVDDRSENVDVLVDVLAPLGQNVVTANSGEEALKRLLQHDCAVILLDVRMEGMDGFETAAHIKKRDRTRHVPIIFLTALDTDPYHALRGYSEGAVDYIGKPFDPWMLRSKVAVFVELDHKNHVLRQQTHELQRSNEELAELAAVADAASHAKTAFLNMAGHELRTPLAVIMGYASLILEGAYGEPPDDLQKPLGSISDKAAELGTLVEGILDAAKIEAGAVTTEPIAADLNALTVAAVERGRSRAALIGGAITFEGTSDAVPVDVDPQHIGRIMDNLLNNALTYDPERPNITVAVEGGAVPRVTVTDGGRGIPTADRERIFERFVRGQEAGSGPAGTGLGLFISRDLARRNGAEVSLVSSEVGVGSVFALTFGNSAAQVQDEAAPTMATG